MGNGYSFLDVVLKIDPISGDYLKRHCAYRSSPLNPSIARPNEFEDIIQVSVSRRVKDERPDRRSYGAATASSKITYPAKWSDVRDLRSLSCTPSDMNVKGVEKAWSLAYPGMYNTCYPCWLYPILPRR